MDVLAVGVGGHDEGMLTFGEAHRQFIAHLVGLLRRDLPRLEGLPDLVSNDIVFLAAPGGQLILPLG